MRINDDEDGESAEVYHCDAQMLMNLLGTRVCAGNMSTSIPPVLAGGDEIRVFGERNLGL